MVSDRQVFAYRVITILTAVVVYVCGKGAGYREAERLFTRGAEFGRTSQPTAR